MVACVRVRLLIQANFVEDSNDDDDDEEDDYVDNSSHHGDDAEVAAAAADDDNDEDDDDYENVVPPASIQLINSLPTVEVRRTHVGESTLELFTLYLPFLGTSYK